MDIQAQIDYWQNGSVEDVAAAESLLDKGHFRHALFFAHLGIEKMLKAHVVKQTQQTPPKIHNLIRLAEIAKMDLEASRLDFLNAFDAYQLEGRYPDAIQIPLDKKNSREELTSTEEMLKWLQAQL